MAEGTLSDVHHSSQQSRKPLMSLPTTHFNTVPQNTLVLTTHKTATVSDGTFTTTNIEGTNVSNVEDP